MRRASEMTERRPRFECFARALASAVLGFSVLTAAWGQSASSYGSYYPPSYSQQPYSFDNSQYYQGSPGQESSASGFSGYQAQPQSTYGYDTQFRGGSGQQAPSGGFSGYQAQPQSTYGYDTQFRGGSGQQAPSGGFSGYQAQPQPAYGYDRQFWGSSGQQAPADGFSGYQEQPQTTHGFGKRSQGGPSQEHPTSGFPAYPGQQPTFGYDSPAPRAGHVPTPGFRFRETNKRPEPEVELPQFRPDSMQGKSPYSWGGSNTQWPQGGMGPAPVFRPLDDEERKRAKRREDRGTYGTPYYPSPDYGSGYPVR